MADIMGTNGDDDGISNPALTGTVGRDIIYGLDGNDIIDGLAGNDFLHGDAGDDTLYSGDGRDYLYGEDGDDTLVATGEYAEFYGGPGDDVFVARGAQGSDYIAGYFFDDGPSGIVLDMEAGTATDSYGDTDTLIGIARVAGSDMNDLMYGSSGPDELMGFRGNDMLYGLGGDDILSSFSGLDRLDGGPGDDLLSSDYIARTTFVPHTGDDRIVGRGAIDTVDYSTLGSTITVDLGLGGPQFISAAGGMDALISIDNLIGGQGGDRLKGSFGDNLINGFTGNDTIHGQRGDDVVNGGAGNDILRGGNDDDILIGGAGRDILGGGSGSDAFVFAVEAHTANGGFRDRIQDFVQGEDAVDLSGIDAVAGGADDAFTFIGTGPFTGAGQLRTLQIAALNKTIVYGETDADGIGDFQIEVTGLLTLTADDFIL